MLKRFWKSLSSIGLQYHYDDKLVKRIILTNQFSVIGLLVVFLSILNDFLLNDFQSGFILGTLGLFCFSGILLNKFHFHSFATPFLLTVFNLTIFFFDSSAGLKSGTYLFYFPLVLAIGFIFDFTQKRLMLIHFILILCLLLINILTHHELFKNVNLSDHVLDRMFMFNLFFSAASIGFFMYLSIASNIRENIVFEQRINERKATELAIKQALSEKDILLSEIHHRVKNNLAIITSLFNLQMSSITNEEAKNILLDSKNRVKSMALIHDRLYKSDSLSEIDFTKYTHELIDEIKYSYPTIAKNIEVNASINDVRLSVNNAIPFGLILNELLTNCYKHAFTGRDSGKIDIRFFSENDCLKLIVADNGVGLKDGYQESDSLGMVVINSLSDQLDGKSKFTVENGTRFELELNVLELKESIL